MNARRVPDMFTRYPYHRDTAHPLRDYSSGALLDRLTPYERERLERDGYLRRAVTAPYPVEYLGETPTDGEEAAERWLDLHDHAAELCAQLRPGDITQTKIVRRALRSVLLYEHQITPKARRLARLALWSTPALLRARALGTVPVCSLPGHCSARAAGGHCAGQRVVA
jgi:hypothetical protein